jgi:sigma-B regulation protein RsbU (phosphoserine phosphatase)
MAPPAAYDAVGTRGVASGPSRAPSGETVGTRPARLSVAADTGAATDLLAQGVPGGAQRAGRPNDTSRLASRIRADLPAVLLGNLLIVLGLAALGVAVSRWGRHERSLVAFGLFCALYGVRMIVRAPVTRELDQAAPLVLDYLNAFITYVAPIAFTVFLEQFWGRGWKSSIRLVVYLQVAYGATAILLDSLLRTPAFSMPADPWVILASMAVFAPNFFLPRVWNRELRAIAAGFLVFGAFILNANLASAGLLPWRANIEPVGLLLFVGCLGYAVAHRFFANERRLIAITHDLETARRIQASILPRTTPQQGVDVAVRYVPMTSVAGDFYDFLVVDERRVAVLVADVSGHGVPAALIASMVKVAFAAQADHAADPARVLTGMNQVFCGNLEREFVTAVCLFIDVAARKASCACAGHPPPLLLRRASGDIHELRAEGILLGQFPGAAYANTETAIDIGDRFVLYTDGVVEAMDASEEFFGDVRLKRFVTRHADLAPGPWADALLDELSSWTGRRGGAALDDDVTVVVADVRADQPIGRIVKAMPAGLA